MNLLNPKVALFFLAFLPQFTTRDAGADLLRTVMLKLGAAAVVIALPLDVGYALGADALGRRAGRIGQSNSRIQRNVVARIYLAIAVAAAIGAIHG